MANINAPSGFKPKRHLTGSPYNGQYQTFLLDSGDGTAVFVGDVVKLAGSSGVAGQVVSGMDVEGVPTVTKATGVVNAGTSIVGVVVGFSADPLALQNKYRVASTSRLAMVVTDPTVVYEVQEDAVTTPIAAASVGLNATFNGGSGTTSTGVSTATIVSSTVAGTSTFPVRILGLVKRPDNAFNTGGAGTDPAKFEVVFNATGLSVGGAGIAGT